MKKIIILSTILLSINLQAQQIINGKQVYILSTDTVEAKRINDYQVDTVLQIVNNDSLGLCYLLKKIISVSYKPLMKTGEENIITYEGRLLTYKFYYKLSDSIRYEFLGYQALKKYKQKELVKKHKWSREQLAHFAEKDSIEKAKFEQEKKEHKGSVFKDSRDGKVYKIITIGAQTWFAQNLNYEIENSWENEKDTTWFSLYYGRYYTWDAAQEACPDGWHLPEDNEWQTLETELAKIGNSTNNVSLLKSKNGWLKGSDHRIGFNAVAAGAYIDSLQFGSFIFASFWTATEMNKLNALTRSIHSMKPSLLRKESKKKSAYSVRCVKD